MEEYSKDSNDWNGSRVFFWAADAQIRYGTVLETTRLKDVCIIIHTCRPGWHWFDDRAGNTSTYYPTRWREGCGSTVCLNYFITRLTMLIWLSLSAAGVTVVHSTPPEVETKPPPWLHFCTIKAAHKNESWWEFLKDGRSINILAYSFDLGVFYVKR